MKVHTENKNTKTNDNGNHNNIKNDDYGITIIQITITMIIHNYIKCQILLVFYFVTQAI